MTPADASQAPRSALFMFLSKIFLCGEPELAMVHAP